MSTTRSKSPYGNGAVTQQPRGHPQGRRGMRAVPTFMAVPRGLSGVPHGLEYLAAVDGIVVNQLIELLEIFTGIETQNRYSLCNPLGQQAYFAYEESSFMDRQCYGKSREFKIHITDNAQRPVILVNRPYVCCSGFSFFGLQGCCADECLVECPPGNVISRIVQSTTCCNLEYIVLDKGGHPVFRVVGPECVGCCADVEYKILAFAGGAQVGAITKKWGGIVKEAYTDADTFFVHFPMKLDVHLKAALLGATFLIIRLYGSRGQTEQLTDHLQYNFNCAQSHFKR